MESIVVDSAASTSAIVPRDDGVGECDCGEYCVAAEGAVAETRYISGDGDSCESCIIVEYVVSDTADVSAECYIGERGIAAERGVRVEGGDGVR